MNSNQKSKIAEEAVAAEATKRGLIVSRPNVDCAYDLILDDGNSLKKVQIKYAESGPAQNKGSIPIRLFTMGNGKMYRNCYTSTEVDLVLVYIASTKQITALKPNDFDGKSSLTIRIEPVKNGQKKKIKMVEDYLW